MSGIALDYENLRDLMIRDQFLHMCNKDVLLFLKERVPKDIGEMSQLEDRFKEARISNVVSLTNPNLRGYPKNDRKGEDKRFKGDNYDNRKCYNCGVQGHISINCPSQGRPGSMNRGNRYGQDQYAKRNNSCAAITSTRGSVIYSAVGHMETRASIVMPVRRGQLEGKDVSDLRDTGCGGVVVRDGLVDKDSFVDGQQECKMADGSVIKTALAKVYIDSPYFVGEVIAWCMQYSLYDVIIGNVEGARDPIDPDLNHEVGVVTRLQTKKMAQPYSKLKVPNSISNVSVDDIKSAQQSDESLVKIGEQVKSEAILVKGSSSVKYYEKKGLWFRELQSSKVEKGKVYCQLIVPMQYRKDVMHIAHESIMAAI